MLRFATRRLLLTIPVMLITITIAFFILRLAPGGPFDGERPLPAQIKQNLNEFYHLDKPLLVQYGLYLKGLIRGDLGPSFTDFTFSVNEKLALGLPYTLKLGLLCFVVAIIGGVLSGIVSAVYQNSYVDFIVGFLVLFGLVVPNFLAAPILQQYLGNSLNFWLSDLLGREVKIFFVGGWGDGGWRNLTLPTLVLATPFMARISRLMRASMLEVLQSNYIRTARAKGIGNWSVISRHAIKPALVPVLSYLGPAAGYLLTGSIVIENIFGIPGIGRFFIDAALNRDYGMVLGTVIFYILLIIVLNLLVDLLYALLDPKVRYS